MKNPANAREKGQREEGSFRKAAVAGQFYPASSSGLRQQIESFVDRGAKKTDVISCVLPHAGYIYSGRVAAETVSRINIKKRVILLGPNHTGSGAPFSIMIEGAWQTPLGEIEIDSLLANSILNSSRHLESDWLAHLYEHSIEVELPFLQFFRTDFKIVPIAFSSDETGILKEIGKEIAKNLTDKEVKGSTLIIASSDMTHYESQIEAQRKDKEAIDAILELDEDKLVEKIRKVHISMCGYAPVIVMLVIAKILGAKSASLVRYETSAEVTGDKTSVVGYAGITIC